MALVQFEGRKIVSTGGSSGLGLAVAKRIAAQRGEALITGTNAAKLASVQGKGIHILENDEADSVAADALADEARRLFGTIYSLFLNAGIGAEAEIGSMTPEMFRALFDLNVGGVLFGAKALAPVLRDGGSILITASAARNRGLANEAIYSATKGAVRSMTLSLALACSAQCPRQLH
jgi:NAD(P)-dependent dehydrogenase (short-subunit alcohol dehydrogenase family)